MPDLPEISQTWEADTAPFIAGIQAAIDALKEFDAQLDDNLAKLAEFKTALDALDGKVVDISLEGVPEDIAEVKDLKSVIDDLPPVHDTAVDVTGIASDIAGVQALRAVLDGLPDRRTISIGVDSGALGGLLSGGAGAAAETLAHDLTDVANGMENVGRAGKGAAGGMDDTALAMAKLEKALGALHSPYGDLDQLFAVDAKTQAVLREATLAHAAAVDILAAAERSMLSPSEQASGALQGIVAAMNPASRATAIFGLTLSQLHWIFGVSAEALAVLVPAIIAFGAGLAVAMQGANNAYNHMTSLYTATEATNAAFHQTVGTTLGLKDALQQAQDAANPGVYELLGSAVNDTKAGMGQFATAGLQVVHMWDEFAARITVDLQQMQKSGQTTALLGNMVSDLQQLGQVLGNVGHAILNFASDMPGLAEVLLKIVDGISRVILWISELPPWLIKGAMALEEFYRWGGLVATIISRIGLVLPMIGPALLAAPVALFGRLAAIMGSVVGVGAQLVGGLASVAGGIAKVIPAASGAENALSGLSKGMSAMASDTVMMGTLGLLTAGIVAAGIALDHFRSPVQQFIDSVNKAVAAATDLTVLNVLAQSLVATAGKISQQTQALDAYSPAMQKFAESNARSTQTLRGMEGPLAGAGQGAQNLNDKVNSWIGSALSWATSIKGVGNAYKDMTGAGGAQTAASQAAQLDAEQQKLIGTFRTVTGNIGYLSSAYHVSGAAAVTMAQEAGVNLKDALTGSSEAARIARQQIANFVQGLGAMSAPAGVVGNDMQAIGIQSQLVDTKVQQLNQAWDAWMSSVTGSMSDFSQIQTALGTMGSDAAASSASLSGSIGSVKLAASGMTYTLKGMSQNAMQSWQQLTSALNQGNSALDQLRTGMAEGAVSGSQFESTVKGLVGEFIPFVAGNKTAIEMLSNLAHEAGGPVTTSLQQLQQWAGVKGPAAAKQFADGMNNASLSMGKMSTVAKNLSATVSNDLNQAMAASIANVTKIAPLTQTYISDLSKYGANATQTKNAQAALNTAQQQGASLSAQAGNAMAKEGSQAQAAAGQVHGMAGVIQNYVKELNSIPASKTTVITTIQRNIAVASKAASLSGGAHGGMVGPMGIIPGYAGGGVIPGFEPGVDRILAALSAGEGILNPYAVQMLGGAPGVNWLNRAAEHGGGGGAVPGGGGVASGGGGGPQAMHVYLDGKEIFASVKQHSSVYGTRNAGARTGLMIPGQKVGSGIS